MLVDYLSDVHLSHYAPFRHNQEKWKRATKEWAKKLYKNKKSEVLIIAGDMSEWNQQSLWFLEESSTHYERVYFVVGNHDYYLLSKNQRKKYGNSIKKVEELLVDAATIKNVIALHKTVDTYKGVTFAGHSMWYDLPKDEDVAWHRANSNDSRFVFGENPYEEVYQSLYEESLEWYEGLEGEKIDVFVSHFPPFDPPFSKYSHNANYVAQLPFLIGRHFINGHQHLVGEFERFGVNFHMNAIGYPEEKHSLSVKTFKLKLN